ncbi:WhiB family transcriptional regulator [Embleya sp. NPDC001921]
MSFKNRYAPDNLDRPWHWIDEAACAGSAADAGAEFFPLDYGDTGSSSAKAEALYLKNTYCKGCPVRAPCLAHALRVPERHGVWGGLDWTEREKLLPPSKKSKAKKRTDAAKKRADAAA